MCSGPRVSAPRPLTQRCYIPHCSKSHRIWELEQTGGSPAVSQTDSPGKSTRRARVTRDFKKKEKKKEEKKMGGCGIPGVSCTSKGKCLRGFKKAPAHAFFPHQRGWKLLMWRKTAEKGKSRNRGVFHSTARSEVTVSVSVLRRQVFSKQVLNLCFCIGGLYSS